MRLRLPLLAALLCLASPARAFLWLRQTFPSHWTAAPLSMTGDDPAWYGVDATEKAGLDLRAMNDASNLYLRIAADDDVGRALLTGTYRQDLTIWFMGRDMKTHAWGLSFPFSRVPAKKNMTFEAPHFTKTASAPGGTSSKDSITWSGPPSPPAHPEPDPMDQGIEVSLVLDQGGIISTIPFAGSGVEFQNFGDNHHPVYQLLVPLVQLPADTGKPIPFDLVTGHCSPDVQKQYYAYQGHVESGVLLIAASQAAAMSVSSTTVAASSTTVSVSSAASPSPGGFDAEQTPAPQTPSTPLQNGLPSAAIPTGLPGTNSSNNQYAIGMAKPGSGASGGQGSSTSDSSQDATAFYDFTLPSAETVRMAVRLARPPHPARH